MQGPNVPQSFGDHSVLLEKYALPPEKQEPLIRYVKIKAIIKGFNFSTLKYYNFFRKEEIFKNQSILLLSWWLLEFIFFMVTFYL